MLITKQNVFKVHSIGPGGNRLLLIIALDCRTFTTTYMHQGQRKQFRSGIRLASEGAWQLNWCACIDYMS